MYLGLRIDDGRGMYAHRGCVLLRL
jgi:hypothetical protein